MAWWKVSAVGAVVLLFGVAGCSSGGDSADSSVPVAAPADEGTSTRESVGLVSQEPGGDAEAPPAPEGGIAEAVGQLPPVDAPVGDRVIKQGTVTIEIPVGEFDAAYRDVVEAGRRQGGSVVSSTTNSDDGEGVRGSVTLRVPVDTYEDLLVTVGDVGQVRQRDITAEDVGEEYVDLQARRRNLEAQQAFYLGLIDQSEGVQDAILVQQQLTSITEQLEQISGRLQYLEDRTAHSTLTVELFETGATVAFGSPDDGPSLALALQTAQDAFTTVVGVIIVVAFAFAPVGLPLLLALGVWLLLRRRGTVEPARPAVAPVAAAPTPERDPQLTP